MLVRVSVAYVTSIYNVSYRFPRRYGDKSSIIPRYDGILAGLDFFSFPSQFGCAFNDTALFFLPHETRESSNLVDLGILWRCICQSNRGLRSPVDLGRPGEEEDLFQKASDLAARRIPTILLVMRDLPERALDSENPAGNSDDSRDKDPIAVVSEEKSADTKSSKASILASFLSSTLAMFETRMESSSDDCKATKPTSYGLSTAVSNVMISGPIRRLQEHILGTTRMEALSSTSEIWLLGKCYNASAEESSGGEDPGNSYAEFLEDFSSRIWITYRKGFEPIGDTKFTSDVNWGCMIRSSIAFSSSGEILEEALSEGDMNDYCRPTKNFFRGKCLSLYRESDGSFFNLQCRIAYDGPLLVMQPYDPKYIEILQLFGDSEACAFSVHNLLRAGRHYGLAAGSWLGPYAMCRTWETITRANREQANLHKGKESLPMVVYIVSGDEDGEQGGAPVVCTDVVARLCSSFNMALHAWAPILLLVPLVLGLERINPRYIPLLQETFSFPQSLGILGGKPGASTYIVGVQEDKALYLDPHEVQQAVDLKSDSSEADYISYHCRTVRHVPFDLIDPSLAIGFHCRDKDDFEDFCSRASQLGDKSNGAPLFTVTQFPQPSKAVPYCDGDNVGNSRNCMMDNTFDVENFGDDDAQPGEDEWQIL
ncbi:unnamed protein product [Musa hybrid cultivar]